MKKEAVAAEQMIAALFEGHSRIENMALLGRLEFGGGSIYRAWAKTERNAKARELLLAAAEREDANGKLLQLMSTLKDECEKCHTRLRKMPALRPAHSNVPSAPNAHPGTHTFAQTAAVNLRRAWRETFLTAAELNRGRPTASSSPSQS